MERFVFFALCFLDAVTKIVMSTLSLAVHVIHIQTRDFRAKWLIYEEMARKGPLLQFTA